MKEHDILNKLFVEQQIFNPMRKASLILVMLLAICISAFSQVKKQYADSTEYGTTVVVKEDGASDLDILNSYGDNYSMGDVIRITTENSTLPKASIETEEPTLVLQQTATTKQVAGQEDFPTKKVRKKYTLKRRPAPRPVVKSKPMPLAPANITQKHSSSPSEFRAEALFSKKKGKKKRKKRNKKRRIFKGKKTSCYRF